MRVEQWDMTELRAPALFKGAGADCMAQLIVDANCQTFPAHVELVKDGDPSDFLYVVLDGLIELYAVSHKRETMVGLVERNHTVMLDAVVADEPFQLSARTCQRSRVLMLQAARVRQAVVNEPAFANAVIDALAQALKAITREYKNLRLRSAAERLANRLLTFDAREEEPEQFTLPYDKRILAGVLSMTPENLSRAFVTLRDYGVQVDGATVRLHNRAALRLFAKSGSLVDDVIT